MIVRRGFAATRVADIAAEVGVAPATVHYHFDRKDEILVRALLWTNEQLIADLEASESTEDPVRRLARFIERTIPHPGERRDEYLLEIDLWSWMRIHGEELETYGAYGDRWIEHIRQIIQDGVDVGAFTVVTSAGEVAERLVALTDGLAVQSAIGLSRMPAARVGQMIRHFATEQLGLQAGALH
jgi:AcrR family transcriptional regulator